MKTSIKKKVWEVTQKCENDNPCPIKNKIIEFAENTTTHGVPSFVRSKKAFIKVMWMFFILTSGGTCIYFTVSSVQSFLKFEIVSEIRVIPNRPISFPVVTICNVNYFPTEFGYNLANEILANSSLNDINGFDVGTDNLNLKATLILYHIVSNIVSYSDEIKQKVGYSKEQFVVDCVFDGSDCYDNLKWTFSVYNGNCFQFNLDATMRQAITAQSNALYLTLRIGSEYEHELVKEKGALIILSDHGEEIRYSEGALFTD
jgi:hypothetical protein